MEARRDEGEVLLWDLNRIEEQPITLDRIKLEPQRRSFAAFSPDGKTVAIASNKGSAATVPPTTVTVAFRSAWDGQSTGQIIDTQAEILGSIALGASNVLATASGNTIQFWDREAGTFLSSLSSPRGTPRLMRFNAHGTLLATVVANHAEIWDTVSHKLLAVLPAVEWISDISFTPDGRSLAVGGRSSSTSVWRVSNSAARVQLGGFESRPTSMTFSPDGCLAIGASNGDVWCYRDGDNRCTISASATTVATESIARNPDRDRDRGHRTPVMYDAAGRLIAHDLRGLRIWQGGSALSQPPSLVAIPINAHGPVPQVLLARSTDGQTMVLVRSSEVSLWQATHPDRVRRVVAPPQAPGEEPPPFFGPPLPPPTGATAARASGSRFERGGRPGNPNRNGGVGRDPFAVQLAPRGERIYMLGDFNKLIIWALDPEDGSGPIKAHRLESPKGLPEGLTSLALRSDGSLLAIGDRTGTVTLFDTARLSVLGRINPPSEDARGALFALTFSPDGRQLAVGSPQGQISLWSVANPSYSHCALRLPGQRGMVTNLVFDSLGQRLASSSAGIEPMIEIWNLELLERELTRLGFSR